MEDEFSRTFRYATQFYLKRLGLIVIFSIPFILSVLILGPLSAPNHPGIGGVFVPPRRGSLPELSLLDVILTAVAYALSVFIVADTIVNINIVVRSKRTLTSIRHEIMQAMGTYATRIFYIYTMMLLLLFIAQLLTFDNPYQSLIYPLFAFVLSSLLFFVPPAVVIDNSDN